MQHILLKFDRILTHLVEQNAHNAAKLTALTGGVAQIISKLEGTEFEEEVENLRRVMNDNLPHFLGDALDSINDVPDIS